MAGRHHEVVPSKGQQGAWSEYPGPPICGDCECPGCKCVEHGLFQSISLGFRRVNSRQATDLVTWYYQDVQPHYPGVMAAGEGSVSVRIYPSDLLSLHPGSFVGPSPHVEPSQVGVPGQFGRNDPYPTFE